MSGKDIFVLPEIRKGELDSTAFALLTKGRELADQLGVRLVALLVGYRLEDLIQSLSQAGANTILVADHPALTNYNAEAYCHLICEVLKDWKPRFLLLGYTYWGMELGPALAEGYSAYMVSNCIDLDIDGSAVRVVRPMFAGGYHAQIELKGKRPYVVSFQKGALPKPVGVTDASEVIQVRVEMGEDYLHSKVVELVEPSEGEVDITKAEIIVAVGRGVADKANITMIRELSDALGGCMACSRPVSDLGWLPKEYHVGISGKTVAPKIYIACGISGSSQHVAGMEDSKMIVAINKDANAPIFRIAHYGIVGDIFKVVPELICQARLSQKM